MALKAKLKDVEFGVGDKVRVVQKIKEGDTSSVAGKFREATFEGMVIGIKGRDNGKSFTVRKIAEGSIGVERIFPLSLPSIDRIVVVKEGVRGVARAKLYYTRTKAPTEVEMIHKKASVRKAFKESKKSASIKRAPKKSRKQSRKKS